MSALIAASAVRAFNASARERNWSETRPQQVVHAAPPVQLVGEVGRVVVSGADRDRRHPDAEHAEAVEQVAARRRRARRSRHPTCTNRSTETSSRSRAVATEPGDLAERLELVLAQRARRLRDEAGDRHDVEGERAQCAIGAVALGDGASGEERVDASGADLVGPREHRHRVDGGRTCRPPCRGRRTGSRGRRSAGGASGR